MSYPAPSQQPPPGVGGGHPMLPPQQPPGAGQPGGGFVRPIGMPPGQPPHQQQQPQQQPQQQLPFQQQPIHQQQQMMPAPAPLRPGFVAPGPSGAAAGGPRPMQQQAAPAGAPAWGAPPGAPGHGMGAPQVVRPPGGSWPKTAGARFPGPQPAAGMAGGFAGSTLAPRPGAGVQGGPPPAGGPPLQPASQQPAFGAVLPPGMRPGLPGAPPPTSLQPGMAPPGPPAAGPVPPYHQQQQQQQQQSLQQPAGGAFPGPAYTGQRLVEAFESLMLSAGPGAPEVDSRALARPVGEQHTLACAPQPAFNQGNCSADNMRPTVMGVPNSTALRLRWQLPLGVIVRPMADEAAGRSVPVIPLGSHGIVRCRRCRTYMNPFCTWVDGGRRFKCNVCPMLNEVPVEYFSTLDANGLRRDVAERPELHCGTVEWVAPQEYMVRPPMPPVFFFAIDVSQAAYASGMVAVAAQTIKACLGELPGDERTLVGFLTYDSSLHFYNLKASLAAPQMLVVTELDDPFLPMPDDLLVNLQESRELVDALLDALPAGYSSTSTSNDSAMGPALQAAFLVMGHLGGKLLLFQAGLPTLGPGKLKPSRDNLSLYNTDREAQLRNPEDPFFKRFAGEASSRQITLDVFLGTAAFADLASLASIPRYTCGQVYYYPGFHAARDGPRLAAELRRNLTRPTAWEAVMRIRCSSGLKISSFHGHFFNRSTDLLALPTCDPDKTFAVQIGHEETMVSGSVAYVQCALLHTSSNGERRIRVHTMMLPVLSELSELYRAADGGATACLLAKLGVEKSLLAKLEDTRQALTSKLTLALKEYRLLHGAHVRNPGALIYPSSLRYLPAYVLGLIKSTAFRGTGRDVPADVRAAAAHSLMAASVEDTLQLAYPRVYDVTDAGSSWGTAAGGKVVLPETLPASMAYLRQEGCYLLCNGQLIALWLGRDANPAWLAQVLGPDAGNPAVDASTLPLEPPKAGSNLSQRVCQVLAALRAQTAGGFAAAFAVRQGSPTEAHITQLFVEDRGQGQFGYADFLQQLHRGIASK